MRKIKKIRFEDWAFKDRSQDFMKKMEIRETDIISITETPDQITVWYWSEEREENSEDTWEGIEW